MLRFSLLSILVGTGLFGCETMPAADVSSDPVEMTRNAGLLMGERSIPLGTYLRMEGLQPVLAGQIARVELLAGNAFRRQAACATEPCTAPVVEGYYEESSVSTETSKQPIEVVTFIDGTTGVQMDAYAVRQYDVIERRADSVEPGQAVGGHVLRLERLDANGAEHAPSFAFRLVDTK